jgi:general nucleoside transport system permease protein
VNTVAAPVVAPGEGRWARQVRTLGASLLAVSLALMVGAVVLLIAGASPVAAYRAMFRGAFGSEFAISQLLVGMVPLLVIGLGLALAFGGRVWNIGAEGQFHLGALAGGALAITFPLDIAVMAVPFALLAGVLAGAAWGWVVGFLRGRWGVNEVITSLLLNYVAIFLFAYFIRQPLRDPEGFLPQSRAIPDAVRLPFLPGIRVHAGLLIALALVPLLLYLVNRTPFGFHVTAMGLNAEAARANGLDTGRIVMWLMALSGAFAGLAGIIQILGLQFRLQTGISPGFGFTAIIVALLGRTRPLGVLLAAGLISALAVGGDSMQVVLGVPVAAVHTIQALFVLFLLVVDRAVRR